ncbi:MAG: hypothetical protein J6B10_01925 [Lachnospiraceae bacterium]|nr:hypothetical protein [Lachnospiraceae bacterium]
MKRFLAAVLAGSMVLSTGMMASAAELSDLFDASYYAQMNPDVAAAVGNDEAALYQHFVTSGMAEGRSASAMFDVEQYKKKYPDLVRIFKNNTAAYYNHYLNNGMAEGRDGGGFFDPTAYAKAYPDVVAALGNNPKALYQHFMTAGLAEGRTAGLNFNSVAYAALNPDLKKKYGTDKAALFREYITEGAAQGRKGARADKANKWYCDQKGDHTVENWVTETYANCTDPGVQRGFCSICGEEVTNISKADGYSHIDKNQNDKCDLCNARLNTYAKK